MSLDDACADQYRKILGVPHVYIVDRLCVARADMIFCYMHCNHAVQNDSRRTGIRGGDGCDNADTISVGGDAALGCGAMER